MSAPASVTLAISSARWAKSAERMDGAIFLGLAGVIMALFSFRLFDQFRGKEVIHLRRIQCRVQVTFRRHKFRRFRPERLKGPEPEIGMPGQKSTDDLFILFRFGGAGTVHQYPA